MSSCGGGDRKGTYAAAAGSVPSLGTLDLSLAPDRAISSLFGAPLALALTPAPVLEFKEGAVRQERGKDGLETD